MQANSRFALGFVVLVFATSSLGALACSGGGSGTGGSSGSGTSSGASSGSSDSGTSDGTSGNSSGASSGTGGGTACQKSADCPTLSCACSDGSSTSYQGCLNGRCETSCPANDHTAGATCVVPNGCFCASGACQFSTNTCCSVRGTAGSGAACKEDCDCASGTCSFDSCF